MSATRTERDSMGPMEVPADAYYGASTQRALENFPISGQGIPAELVRALGMIKSAAAVVNHDKGIVDDEQFRAMSQAAQEVMDGKLNEPFVGCRGAGQSRQGGLLRRRRAHGPAA